MNRPLLITVCVNPDCRWSAPTYIPDLLSWFEDGHKGLGDLNVPGHDVFKRIEIDEHRVPTVLN